MTEESHIISKNFPETSWDSSAFGLRMTQNCRSFLNHASGRHRYVRFLRRPYLFVLAQKDMEEKSAFPRSPVKVERGDLVGRNSSYQCPSISRREFLGASQ